MIVLWLLVAHLVGDYLFQTRWQANGKFGWTADAMWLRLRHVGGYTAAFAPVAFVYGRPALACAFLAWLAVLHFLTDAQRFAVTPGEWVAWRLGLVSEKAKLDAHTRQNPHPMMSHMTFRPASSDGLRITPNPWPSIGLAIDQTLHLVQIAVLAEWLLR